MQPGKEIINKIELLFAEKFSESVKVESFTGRGGGCINNAGKLNTSAGDFFLKWNSSRFNGMFDAEAYGLKLLSETKIIKVPEVIFSRMAGNEIFLVLEWIEEGRKNNNFWEEFGAVMAALHKNNTNELFGLDKDNFIGSLPQYNKQHKKWVDFFINQRIEVQLKFAQDEGLISRDVILKFERMYLRLDDFFPAEKPALIHGDLWSGNFMVTAKGNACIIDPAVYFGHREMELAYTTLFGGFNSEFYQTYEQQYPLEPGFANRKDIYNIYPLLVHLNLFGIGYLSSITSIIKRF